MIFSIKWRWILYNQFNSWSFLNQLILAFTNFTCYDSIVLKLGNIMLYCLCHFSLMRRISWIYFFIFLIGICNLENYNKLFFFKSCDSLFSFFIKCIVRVYKYKYFRKDYKVACKNFRFISINYSNPGNWLTFINAFIIAN